MKKLRIGIIGCGWFGNRHLDYLLSRNDVEVAALVSSNAEKLRNTMKKAPQAAGFPDYPSMLDQITVDALILCLPPYCHGSIEEDAAKKGIHLYVEKPLGIDRGAVMTNEASIKESGILCAVGYQERYGDGIRHLKEILRHQTPHLIHGTWIDSMPATPWWKNKALSGGQIVEQSTHIVDLMRYLFGEGSCRAATSSPQKQTEGTVEDASIVTLQFRNGVIGTLLTGCFLRPQTVMPSVELEIFGSDLYARFTWGKGILIRHGQEQFEYAMTDSHHDRALDAFIKAVQTGDSSLILSDYSDAVKTFDLTMQMEKLLTASKPVL